MDTTSRLAVKAVGMLKTAMVVSIIGGAVASVAVGVKTIRGGDSAKIYTTSDSVPMQMRDEQWQRWHDAEAAYQAAGQPEIPVQRAQPNMASEDRGHVRTYAQRRFDSALQEWRDARDSAAMNGPGASEYNAEHLRKAEEELEDAAAMRLR